MHQGLGTAHPRRPRGERARDAANLGIELGDGIEIHNARLSHRNADYAGYLYKRLQRQGYLVRDCQRLVNQDRNHYAACMVALGDVDAMVTGVTRNYSVALGEVRHVHRSQARPPLIGVSLVLARGRTVLVADTAVTEMPNGEELAEITIEAAGVARRLGYEPRAGVARVLNLRPPAGRAIAAGQEAVRLLDQRRVDFEYDGEMAADVALNPELMAAYPFCRLSGPANVLVMPAFHSAVDLDQDAAGARRRDRDRATAGRARQAGADRQSVGQGFRACQHGGARRL